MKNILIEIIKCLLKVFFVFPIKENVVLFSAYSGKSYSCNPKYITEEILRKNVNLDLVWAFIKPKEMGDLNDKIRTIRFKSLKYIYYSCTAKVIVDNVEGWSILPRRKNQYVINTWHGGGAYKGVGLQRKDSSAQTDRNMIRKNERVSIYLSSSRVFTELTLRNSFRFNGEVINCGMPRNDILIKNNLECKNMIKCKLNIEKTTKIVLFAPTFRHDTKYQYSLNYSVVLNALKERFGGEWLLLVRAHYYVNEEMMDSRVAMNVSAYPDMQELLLISDVLITDYSSSIWDFSLMKKAGFLFMPDYNDYMDERSFYTPISEWPYPASFSMDDLVKSILNYEEQSAVKKIEEHHKILGSYEDGRATDIVVKKIIEM
ncbi:CDP-glycerol glycerophosphotransferase family protein [Parabacteroides sp.]|uniref:CDP-glycerol glycerophosphotransferase family protein n=1 Tax=Parabacteroides sp. TaxID=1869337 RepID=UPI00257B526B|nr:CDP-glycerol glycerophosphotransferase family protein [Parabacteroides sp.]